MIKRNGSRENKIYLLNREVGDCLAIDSQKAVSGWVWSITDAGSNLSIY